MKRMIVPITFVIAIGVLISGNLYWNNHLGETATAAKKTLAQNDTPDASKSNEKESKADKDKDKNKDKDKDTTSKQDNTDITKESTSASKDNDDESKDEDQQKGDQPQSFSAIKEKYTPLFNELKVQETSKVDQVLVEAKAEYISKKSSKSEIVAKYEGVSQQLETNADRSFNIIYQQLQLDLEKNGHSLNKAQEFQRTYNSEKQERSNRILSAIEKF